MLVPNRSFYKYLGSLPFLHYSTRKMSSTKTYQTSVHDLNSLQTNYQIVQQIKASGGRLNQYSIPEFAAFIEKLGHQVSDLNRLNVIHVTGTKGKGSTCAFVNSLLQNIPNNRLKVGLFTSPHLIEVRERIQINGEPVSQEMFAKYFYQVYDGLKQPEPPLRMVTAESPQMPMYFRFLTLMAYHTFLREQVDVAIMEVGVGGQYDSTNVIEQPKVCGIASLGLDHQNSLGDTIESIAWHKGGIIKNRVPVFTVEQLPSALEVLEQRAAENEAPLRVIPPLNKMELGIPGEHQRVNAALAVALCKEWIRRTDYFPDSVVDDSQWIKDGLRLAKWPGRSQTFTSKKSATWHVDGAHTTESMAACARWFTNIQHTKCVLLFNAAHSRDASNLLNVLWENTKGNCEYVDAVFCSNLSNRPDSTNHTVQNDEALEAQHKSAGKWMSLSNGCRTTVKATINEAVEYIEQTYGGQDVHVLATGSLHLVGGVLDVAKGSI